MRNLFDQYTQPENRLTHSLATVLDQDRALLRSFLSTFCPKKHPPVGKLKVIEQSLPGKPELAEGEKLSKGLPDSLIFDDDGWVLMIESKIGDNLTRNQLRRHYKTVEKCGFDRIAGLAITAREPEFRLDGWHTISWKDVYAWGHKHKKRSQWAGFLVDYFDAAESRMADDKYLKKGTITEFTGISFDPYTYLEAKRILRLLTQKMRDNTAFIRAMRLDPTSGRSAISDQARLWDFISFIPADGKAIDFQKFPHCTVAIGLNDAEAMITFPHAMRAGLRKRLHGESFEDFAERLRKTSDALIKALRGMKAYRPIVRVMQRRYKSQRSVPFMDGRVEFDLRATFGDESPNLGPRIKEQQEWARSAYELLSNKRSNIQFQIGVQFFYPKRDELADKKADRHFISTFRALRSFVGFVID